MNAKRQTSLMLAAVWVCGIGLPVSDAPAATGSGQLDLAPSFVPGPPPQQMHGNNPKYGVEDDTLDQPPKDPPHADWSPKVRSALENGHSVVLARGGSVLPGLPDLRSDIDSPFEFEEIDLSQDPSSALRAMLLPPGPAPYAGPESPDLVGLLPEAEISSTQLPGIPRNGAVPAPGTLAILGLAAAIAGRRRRRHT
jgi:hypothetical protein